MKLLEKARDKEFWKYVREGESFKAHRDDLLKMYNSYAVNDIPAVNTQSLKCSGAAATAVYTKKVTSAADRL